MSKTRNKSGNILSKLDRKMAEMRAQKELVETSELDAVSQEMVVRDTDHAKSSEVIKWCVKELTQGTTWRQLRKKLGLGNSGVDRRWRIIRETICSVALPKTEEGALEAFYSEHSLAVGELEDFLEKVARQVDKADGRKDEANMLKVQLETMKLRMEMSVKKFENYAKLVELKKNEKKAQGSSILVQNNYYIPRPGDNLEAKEVGPGVIEVE